MSPDGSARDEAAEGSAVSPRLHSQATIFDPNLGRRPSGSPSERSESEPLAGDPAPGGGVSSASFYSTEAAAKPFAMGAMGAVWLAYDEKLGRPVVLKILRQAHLKNRGLRERFRREAMITAQLQHPGVPPVFGMGWLTDGRPFFSMRLVEGQTLAQLLENRGDPLKERPRLLTIFEQVCQTLAFAHARGIIHRDVKPANIVVGEYGSVYVMDWGIARFLIPSLHVPESHPPGDASPLPTDETVALHVVEAEGVPAHDTSITVAGALLGTPQYMSPEQAAGAPLQDERTDVFSLGAILFEILTGQPLRPLASVPAREMEEYARAYWKTGLSALDKAQADAPIVDLAKRCLDPNPEGRPRTAADVAAEVTAYLLHVLQRPERIMARFFELSLDLFCLAGFDGYFKRINDNFTRILGYSTEELLSRPFVEYVHPDDRDATMQALEQLRQGLPVVQFENRYRDRDGDYKWIQWTAKSVPEEELVFAIAREITTRKRLEQRLGAIVETSPVAMVVSDKEGRILELNRAAEQLLGYDRSELAGQPIEILIPERFRVGHFQFRQVFAHHPSIRYGSKRELWALRKDGAEIPVEVGLSLLETEEGNFVVSSMADVTEFKRQQRLLDTLMSSFPAALVLIDQSGAIRLVNDQAERLFGYERDELNGQPLSRLFPELTRSEDQQSPADVLAGLTRTAEGDRWTARGMHHNGAELLVKVGLNTVDHGEHLLAITPAPEVDQVSPGATRVQNASGGEESA